MDFNYFWKDPILDALLGNTRGDSYYHQGTLFASHVLLILEVKSDAYLEPSRTSTKEHFCEKYFRKNAPS